MAGPKRGIWLRECTSVHCAISTDIKVGFWRRVVTNHGRVVEARSNGYWKMAPTFWTYVLISKLLYFFTKAIHNLQSFPGNTDFKFKWSSGPWCGAFLSDDRNQILMVIIPPSILLCPLWINTLFSNKVMLLLRGRRNEKQCIRYDYNTRMKLEALLQSILAVWNICEALSGLCIAFFHKWKLSSHVFEV